MTDRFLMLDGICINISKMNYFAIREDANSSEANIEMGVFKKDSRWRESNIKLAGISLESKKDAEKLLACIAENGKHPINVNEICVGARWETPI